MKKLLIVESPAKIKTINKFIGQDFIIMSTLGHLKDLPTREIGITINDKEEINLTYVTLDKKQKIINDICAAAKKVDEVYIAPDPDREGELIAWHVQQEIEKYIEPKKIHRISFNEITKPAIEAALAHASTVDLDKVAAQQARRVLDRWVGYEVSPILWRKIKKGLSAGRVQSVALRLICDREQEIRGFTATEYWSIHSSFIPQAAGPKAVPLLTELNTIANKKIEINNEKQAQEVLAQIKQESFILESIKDTQRSKNPLPPFMTSTLQQSAYNRLGFSVSQTMMIAQKLYEGIPLDDPKSPVALITYMRTDSTRIAESALEQTRTFIKKEYGAKYLPEKPLLYTKKKSTAQDAHEAIRPIDVTMTPRMVTPYVEKNVAQLYELIWQRFIACQTAAALYANRQITIKSKKFVFKTTGSTLLFDGFLKVLGTHETDEEQDTDNKLPDWIEEKLPLTTQKIDPKQHFTQPPPRYTEASLVKELEKAGIGRPSTYATILRTIQAREYTSLDTKKRFVPSDLGMTVTAMLVEHLPEIMNISFTASMEENLDGVAQGKLARDLLLNTFYKAFSQALVNFSGQAKKNIEQTGIPCPTCKEGSLLVRLGKAGSFVGCSAYPTCTFTSGFERDAQGKITLQETPTNKLLDIICPQCNHPLQQRIGRYGPFVSCSQYPTCKYIHQEVAAFPCPLCGGQLVKRTWRGSIFWGCKNYPTCTFSIRGDILNEPCPLCKHHYLVIKKTREGMVATCPGKNSDGTPCGYTKKLE
jgi:DNA topoisomerase-1